jgi:enoyl-CoA hydratase/carnithine racemase
MTVRRELQPDGVLLLTLDRPERKNAFDETQWDDAARALGEGREDPRVACLVLTGAGGDFSAGVDLRSLQHALARGDRFESGYDHFMTRLGELDKPLLAAVRGVGVGIGATVLFHCDVVYLGAGARLRLPFAALGLVPEGASSYLLPQIVGARAAAELLLGADWIDAPRALELGIATRVFPDDQVLAATLARAGEIAQHDTATLQAIKRTLLAHRRAGIEAARTAEAAGMRAQAGGPANREAIAAFLEKRRPDFRKLRGPSPT